MLENNNFILICGKAGSYKSSLGLSILNSCNKKCCYIDLEGNNHLNINSNINICNDINEIDKCINDNDVILIDYIELSGYSIDNINELKERVKPLNKTILMISCLSNDENLYKESVDLIINVTKNS